MVACLLLTFLESGSFSKWTTNLHTSIIKQPVETLKVAVPSFIYVVQNNLQFLAVSNLDAATFQVTYQLKVLTTALFSVFMLNKTLRARQWGALCLLFIGIVLVQLQPSQLTKSTPTEAKTVQKPLVGFIAVLISSLCSGFAGVYFEKILKGPGSGSAPAPSIWVRNIQLGLFGTAIGFIGMYLKDGDKIKEHGILFGYSPLVWVVVGMQAFGGLLVAVVVKYADNILKNFATSLAIIVSCIVSLFFFNFVLSVQFLIGMTLVMIAIYNYSAPPPQSAK